MYFGRFAPSPSGRLHGGSLLTGLAAVLRAKHSQGTCLIRIEDLDFPRCAPTLTPLILQELYLLGLFEHSVPLSIQSHNLPTYHNAIYQLYAQRHAYICSCTRAQLKERPCPCYKQASAYAPQHSPTLAKSLNPANALAHNQASAVPDLTAFTSTHAAETWSLPDLSQQALRIELGQYLKQANLQSFEDVLLGKIALPKEHELASSLIIQRRDGIIAYNLAVVVDDHQQGITEIVRGADLLETTFLQLALYEIFGYTPPRFLHVPLILDEHGQKLSKQNHAPAILAQLLPHEAIKQAALQLNQPLSVRFYELYAQQCQIVQELKAQITSLLESFVALTNSQVPSQPRASTLSTKSFSKSAHQTIISHDSQLMTAVQDKSQPDVVNEELVQANITHAGAEQKALIQNDDIKRGLSNGELAHGGAVQSGLSQDGFIQDINQRRISQHQQATSDPIHTSQGPKQSTRIANTTRTAHTKRSTQPTLVINDELIHNVLLGLMLEPQLERIREQIAQLPACGIAERGQIELQATSLELSVLVPQLYAMRSQAQTNSLAISAHQVNLATMHTTQSKTQAPTKLESQLEHKLKAQLETPLEHNLATNVQPSAVVVSALKPALQSTLNTQNPLNALALANAQNTTSDQRNITTPPQANAQVGANLSSATHQAQSLSPSLSITNSVLPTPTTANIKIAVQASVEAHKNSLAMSANTHAAIKSSHNLSTTKSMLTSTHSLPATQMCHATEVSCEDSLTLYNNASTHTKLQQSLDLCQLMPQAALYMELQHELIDELVKHFVLSNIPKFALS